MGLQLPRWILEHFMCISSKKIRTRLTKMWPALVHVWLTDPVYLPAPNKITNILELWEGELNKYAFKKNILECEEFSLFCHAFVKQHQIYHYNDKYNWAFGECMTKKDNLVHSCNLYLTLNNIYMVEPQTGAYWQAQPDDKVFFVKM
jgi:hypothetical protein